MSLVERILERRTPKGPVRMMWREEVRWMVRAIADDLIAAPPEEWEDSDVLLVTNYLRREAGAGTE